MGTRTTTTTRRRKLPLLGVLIVACRTSHAFHFTFLSGRAVQQKVSRSSPDQQVKQDAAAEPKHRPPPPMLMEEYEAYSRCLSPKEERDDVLTEGEAFTKKQSTLRKIVRAPASLFRKIRSSRPGALILLHCGESTMNANQTFTGWLDPDLTDRGIQECQHAGRLLLAEGMRPDVVYTSRLTRAIKSTWHLLDEMDAYYTPVFKTYRLNQRSYGSLQGLSKIETAKEFGAQVVQAWRNSPKARPPPADRTDPLFPGNHRRYDDLPPDRIPVTESLLDCQERARPLWEHRIRKDLRRGKTVMVVAHGESLRGLVKVIEDMQHDVGKVSVPTGIPFVYRFNQDMKPLAPTDSNIAQEYTSSTFLEKPGLLEGALKRQERWKNIAPGDSHLIVKRGSNMENSLLKLKQEQNLFHDTKDRGGVGKTVKQALERWSDDASEFEDFTLFNSSSPKDIPVTIEPLVEDALPVNREGPFVVLIRHGRTPHNQLGLFTGWEDPPLAPDGVEDAKNAGKLLRRHSIEFDVVYTSWLTRAIQTAHYVTNELDSVWLPIIKSWRLNERMYGALTGKSKKMIANEYGEEQLKRWRRGYTVRPPPVSSYSLRYPGNDIQRTKHFKDLRISISETICRSLEQRRLVLHRKFPKTESLSDCMARSIPFYTKRIQEEAVDKGKRVLITGHENALRGILMHLCDIPEEAMNQLHLPNGLPLLYDVKGRCISLLDDGSGNDPMDAHEFGPAAKYLFKPCEISDEFYDKMELRASAKAIRHPRLTSLEKG
jgi:2,3-bisphosphoglycerate-dependent phosphoglycerate mutase